MPKNYELLDTDHFKVTVKDLDAFEKALQAFGFVPIKEIPASFEKPAGAWGSGDAVFVLYDSSHALAKPHFARHGDTIFDEAFVMKTSGPAPKSIEGVGGMKHSLVEKKSFPRFPAKRGVTRIDHNTINVDRGEMDKAVSYYMEHFGLEKAQYFDIKGTQTGLTSWVTRTPNRGVQIPFNEATDSKSQIQEYIDIHKGPGVQHIAFLTPNIIETMEAVASDKNSPIKFLEILDTYYEIVWKRVQVKESKSSIERLRILADQDASGYLLQIFTQVCFGGFFIELIQREGCQGFGEGNFKALFESMELDQKRRGVL